MQIQRCMEIKNAWQESLNLHQIFEFLKIKLILLRYVLMKIIKIIKRRSKVKKKKERTIKTKIKTKKL